MAKTNITASSIHDRASQLKFILLATSKHLTNTDAQLALFDYIYETLVLKEEETSDILSV